MHKFLSITAAALAFAAPAVADDFLVCSQDVADEYMTNIMSLDRFDVTGGQTAQEVAIEARSFEIADGCESAEGEVPVGAPYASVSRDGVTVNAAMLDDGTVAISLSGIFDDWFTL